MILDSIKLRFLELLKVRLKTERVLFDAIFIYLLKIIYNALMLRQPENKTIVWIVGCQRSGTSLMNRVFTRDFRIWVYRERSSLSDEASENKLRLRPYPEVKKEIEKVKFPYIIAKPLVETQNILEILDYFPNSKALWMYRDYKDFARSNVARFDKPVGMYGMEPITQRDLTNWRSQGVSDYVYEVVSKYYFEGMSVYDASALFWFARNQLFFELNLDAEPRVFMCRYKDLVEHPQVMLKEIYGFIGIDGFDAEKSSNEINSKSVGRGNSICLSPGIEDVCESLLHKMNNVYLSKQPKFSDNEMTLV